MTTGKPLSETRKSRPPTSCSHDRLAYNVAKTNPVLQAAFDQLTQETWVDPFALDSNHNRLLPRQGDINNAGTNMSSNFVSSIGSTAGCPTTQQIVRCYTVFPWRNIIFIFPDRIGVHGRCR